MVHHYTKKELEEKKVRDDATAIVVAKGDELADMLADDIPSQEKLLDGLTEKDRLILRLKLRGFTQTAIAKVVDLKQPAVSKALARIRNVHEAKGLAVNQGVVVGETLSVYQEVERRGWEIHHADDSKSLRALDTVMTAREKQLKLLMDLGLLKRAATEHKHLHEASPLVQKLAEDGQTQEVVAQVIDSQLTPLEAPEPPVPEDDKMVDVEFKELEEPAPESEEA